LIKTSSFNAKVGKVANEDIQIVGSLNTYI
jgi:hypothetical protein